MSEIKIFDQGFRRARKPHVCGWCNRPIYVGEKYQYTRAFDPDRKKANSEKWGAFVNERRHDCCTAEAIMGRATGSVSEQPLEPES